MIKIPAESKWYQINRGNIYGSIWGSMGIDLTSQRDNGRGNLRLNRTLLGASSAGDGLSSLGVPVAFRRFDDKTYAVCGTKLFAQGSAFTSVWGEVSSTPTNFSSKSDMEIFNGKLYISEGTDDDLRSYDGSSWAEVAFNEIGTAPHMMCVYADRLYVSGATATTFANSVIKSMSTAESVAALGGSYTISIIDGYANIITFLRPVSDGIWIGAVNTRGGKGYVYKWDGVSSDAIDAKYRLQSAGALAGVVKDDVLYIVDADGRLMAFNGGTFVEFDRLPIKENYLKYSLGPDNQRWIHPNGMTVADDRILLLINNEYYTAGLKDTIEENVPSGIWEWSSDTGLYHKMALSNTPLSGAGSGSLIDYGQNRIEIAGALTFVKQNATPASDNGSLFAGAQIYTDATSTIYGIFIDDLNDTAQKYGYFITPRFYSNNIEDTWQKVFVRHKKLLASTDKIVVKYRVDEVAPAEATVTWTDTNTFTSTDADFANYVVGDEVEVIQGKGSGKCAHISTISELAGTYTVELDDTFTGATGTAIVRLQKWKKCGEGTSQTVRFHEFPLEVNDTSIQLKVCMQFTGKDELDDLILLNKVHRIAG